MRIDREFIKNLLRQACAAQATDIHMKVPGRPALRIGGELIPTAFDRLLPQDTFRAAHSLMELGQVDLPLAQTREAEFGLGLPGSGRFRVHLFRQRGSFGVVIHRIQVEAPTLSDLGVPERFATFPAAAGLVLIGGKRRQALLAGLIDARNRRGPGHVVVLEQRLEYLHKDRAASISQREVGIDTDDFATGVRSAVCQDADWIALGEIPDAAVAEAVLRVAEEGRALVVASLPAVSPARVIEAFAGRFPRDRGSEARQRVSEVLVSALTLGPEGAMCLDKSEGSEVTGQMTG